MNDIKYLFIIFVVLACFPRLSQCLQSNADILVIEAGDNTSLAGAIRRNQEIRVETGGTLTVIPDDGTPGHDGSINLIAPQIYINGTINAVAAAHNTIGAAGNPNGSDGGGGGGYGGAGGRGENNGNGGGLGGSIYGVDNLEQTGSTSRTGTIYPAGYGGGSIRIDAISLTLGANAVLDARGNTTVHTAVGGGSGGCGYLNGIYTLIQLGARLDVSGGVGGPQTTVPFLIGAGGGGGGGRVKIIRHPNYINNMNPADVVLDGGTPGGGDAQYGELGDYDIPNAPTPTPPTLTTPLDGQLVGRSPTFEFSATDPTNSKFLKYQLIVSLDDTFTSLTHTASQLEDSTNWSQPYYASGETAAYTFPAELVGGTTYYWSVSVSSNNGNTWYDAGSQSITARTNRPPEIPVLIQPLDNQTQVSALPAFQIVSSDFEGDDLIFRITLSRSANLSNPQVFAQTYPGWDQLVYTPGGSYIGVTATCQLQAADTLVPNTDYYWKATVLDQPYGQQSDSAIYHFMTTRVLPNAPNLLLPADHYQVPGNQVNFQFQVETSLGNTLAGRVEISEDNFTSVLYTFDQQQDQTGWSQPFYSSGGTASLTLPAGTALDKNKTYYWHAFAYDGPYRGSVSATRSFSLAHQFEFQMIRMLPNPARSVESVQFYVRLSVDAKLTIRIYNKLGKQIDQIVHAAQGGVAGNYINYNVSDYATGVYFYTIEAESDFGMKKVTQKFAVIN